MLTLTEHATSVIRELADRPDTPDGTGLRITTDDTRGALALTLAAEPAPGDEVIDEAGARVFLDQQAALMLDDKSLDAATDTQGRVQFTVNEQEAGTT
jgi:Fe-S cluster assembly iron-binding protein IscA